MGWRRMARAHLQMQWKEPEQESEQECPSGPHHHHHPLRGSLDDAGRLEPLRPRSARGEERREERQPER